MVQCAHYVKYKYGRFQSTRPCSSFSSHTQQFHACWYSDRTMFSVWQPCRLDTAGLILWELRCRWGRHSLPLFCTLSASSSPVHPLAHTSYVSEEEIGEGDIMLSLSVVASERQLRYNFLNLALWSVKQVN